MKRLVALLLCLLMVAMLAACSEKEEKNDGGDDEEIVTEVTVNGDTYTFSEVDGDSVRITGFDTVNDSAHEVAIPAYLDGKLVVEISEEAFASKSSISKIIFPTEADFLAGNPDFVMAEYSLKIEAAAFRGCDNLTELTLPAYVKEMDEFAFYECTLLRSVTFEDGGQLTEIAKGAFACCPALESVTISGNVKVIGMAAFFECIKLENLTLADGVVELGAQSFQRCKVLATVSLPATITMIGANAFSDCDALTAVNYSGSSEQVLNYIDELNLPQ